MLDQQRAQIDGARDKILSGYADLIGVKEQLPGGVDFLRVSTLIGSAGLMLELALEGIDKAKGA